MRPISHSLRIACECQVLAVSNDADDFRRWVYLFHVNGHALTDRIFAGQVLARESFIDDYDVTLIRRFLFGEEAALLQRDFHCPEIVRVSHADPGLRLLSGNWFGLAFDIHRGAGMRS